MAKTKEQMLNVRVNSAESNGTKRDEVFITSDDWSVNRTVYAKPGMFKDGQMGSDAVSALEEKSNKALADEHAAKLEQEAKDREAEKEIKTAAKKEEG